MSYLAKPYREWTIEQLRTHAESLKADMHCAWDAQPIITALVAISREIDAREGVA
jgi:hypothetical protein